MVLKLCNMCMISDTEGRIWGTGESVQAVESVVRIDFYQGHVEPGETVVPGATFVI